MKNNMEEFEKFLVKREHKKKIETKRKKIKNSKNLNILVFVFYVFTSLCTLKLAFQIIMFNVTFSLILITTSLTLILFSLTFLTAVKVYRLEDEILTLREDLENGRK